MEHRIVGTTLPVLELRLDPGDAIVSAAGELSWKSPNVRMRTSVAIAGSGGLFGIVRRVAGGGTLFMTEFTSDEETGLLAFATKVPGAILSVDVLPGRAAIVNRHGFLCATRGVEVSVAIQRKLGVGIFGGEGFVLQKVAGQGQAWVGLSGEVVTRDLQPGESLYVHPGHVGMFEESVQLNLTRIRGIKNMLFGGDGIFLCGLTGPGRVWLQTLPLPALADAIAPFLPREKQDEILEEDEAWAAEAGAVELAEVDEGEPVFDAESVNVWDGGVAAAGMDEGEAAAATFDGGETEAAAFDGDDFHEGDAESTTDEGAFEDTVEAS